MLIELQTLKADILNHPRLRQYISTNFPTRAHARHTKTQAETSHPQVAEEIEDAAGDEKNMTTTYIHSLDVLSGSEEIRWHLDVHAAPTCRAEMVRDFLVAEVVRLQAVGAVADAEVEVRGLGVDCRVRVS